jgi:hypothetical protein
MDIIEKLKKDKKIRSVFDVILQGEEKNKETGERPSDIEVRELGPVQPLVSEPESVDTEQQETRQVREFRTEGMHEFDIESLGTSSDGAIRIEYKTKVCKLIDTGKFDEAIELLKELRAKLTG